MEFAALANPAWHALTGAHAHLAIGEGAVRRYPASMSPFFGIESLAALPELAAMLKPGEGAALISTFSIETPPAGLIIVDRLPLLQMIAPEVAEADSDQDLLPLGAEDSPDMLALAELTKPGPFGPDTYRMGPFAGYRDNGRLVAMTGQRLALPAHTEISGVCTHPDYLGRGYARALVSKVARAVLAEGKTPFLHVLPDNHGATAVYSKLGFTEHARPNVTVLVRPDPEASGSRDGLDLHAERR